jgi:molybdopterin converting factor small subunit
MRVKVNIFYTALQQSINKQDSVEVDGSSVGECLDDLIEQFPGAEKWLFDEQGQLLKHVFVYINAESARKLDLAESVKDGDELIIAALVTGG